MKIFRTLASRNSRPSPSLSTTGGQSRLNFGIIIRFALSVPFVFCLCTFEPAFAQPFPSQRYWITFRDRGTLSKALISSLSAPQLGISDRALWRRSKVLPPDKLIDELDLPVDPSYVQEVRSTGVAIRSTSRWFNAVSAELSPSQLASVAPLPGVASVEPVAVFFRKQPDIPSRPTTIPTLKQQAATSLDYGPSLTQLNAVKIVDVHNRGINGAGVVIGMIDDGFNFHQTHPALKNIKVIAEFDFIQRDSNTSRAPGEFASQGAHGAATLSILGGFDNGKLIGAAYGASFILAKTEIDSVEIQIEEDLYVEALEWMERLGADVVSTSLGYIDWYTYEKLDGKTATTSRAARVAARKGVLLVTAMGNEGNYRDPRAQTPGTLIAPADADSIVSVGASFSDGELAGFSSTGPTADGRTKPEIVAQGVSLTAASGQTGYSNSFSGTSASTPLAAGVAALILSAHPNWTPMQVRERMIRTANEIKDGTSRSQTYPNNFYGWGMADAAKAVGAVRGGVIPDRFILYQNYPNPFNGGTTITVSAPAVEDIELVIYDLLGRRVRTLFTGTALPGENLFAWRDGIDDTGSRVSTGVYVVRLKTTNSLLSHKMLYLK